MRFFLGFLVALMVVGGGGYWYWTTTPQYSIEQVKIAVKSHDLAAFKKFVDVDSVSNSLVEDFLSRPVQRITSRDSLSSGIMRGIIGLVRPTLAPVIKDEIEEFVVAGRFSQASPDSVSHAGADAAKVQATSGQPTLATFDKKFGFRNHAFRSIKSLKVEGDSALADLLFHNEVYNADLLLELQLHKVENHWQIVRLTNFPDFVGKIAQLQLKN